MTPNNNNTAALFIQRRWVGYWLNLEPNFSQTSRSSSPSQNLSAQSTRSHSFHPPSTADQGQRRWPPTGSVNAAANLRGPRELFFFFFSFSVSLPPSLSVCLPLSLSVHGSWDTVELNAAPPPPTVTVRMKEAPGAEEWTSQTNVHPTSSLWRLNQVTPCWETRGLTLTRRGRSLFSSSKTTFITFKMITLHI